MEADVTAAKLDQIGKAEASVQDYSSPSSQTWSETRKQKDKGPGSRASLDLRASQQISGRPMIGVRGRRFVVTAGR